MILKKVDDFAEEENKTAFADRENPNLADIESLNKAKTFRKSMEEIGER